MYVCTLQSYVLYCTLHTCKKKKKKKKKGGFTEKSFCSFDEKSLNT